ncbi:MAG TPA: IS21 family transposase [Candidatus Polarisedimenticolia bacterium]|nr:IS21 family transposase [Candidatus Polarisedimenticolia bacterium]
MPAKRLPMRQIREILRLRHDCHLSNRTIGRAVGLSPSTVSEHLSRAQAAGLSWPLAAELDDGQLEARLFRPSGSPDSVRAMPEMSYLHAELKRDGVTLQLLWVEYARQNPDGYRYSQFCKLYRRWTKKLSVSMRQVHLAGEKVFVDFSGKKPSIVDPKTGEVRQVELFVGVLGASSYTYARAVESQKLECWLDTHVRMLEFFGGCPEIFVPDCLKSGVTGSCRYEPVINRSYEDLASHYGVAVVPARPYRAKDKPKVEVGVQVVQRWILAALRNVTFFSLAQMNAAIEQQLDHLNARRTRHLGASRRELFERLDRPVLRALPVRRYEMARWKHCTVSIDYHVEVEHNLYSVPHQLHGERVEARYTATTVELWFKSTRVASHLRLTGRRGYSTLREHMPASHRAHAEWTPSRVIAWADKTGPATGHLAAAILKNRPHPEQGYRSCLGLMRLGRTHGDARLEAACRRALQLKAYSYTSVKNILAAGLEHQPLESEAEQATLPAHDNVRGPAYYHEEDTC